MGLRLDIPDSVASAMRLPPGEQEQQLRLELAVALYARGVLSLGKARELAGLSKLAFGLLLSQRGLPRHYSAEDLLDDVTYARR